MVTVSGFQVMYSMSADTSGLTGRRIGRETRRRVWGFARPYPAPARRRGPARKRGRRCLRRDAVAADGFRGRR